MNVAPDIKEVHRDWCCQSKGLTEVWVLPGLVMITTAHPGAKDLWCIRPLFGGVNRYKWSDFAGDLAAAQLKAEGLAGIDQVSRMSNYLRFIAGDEG